MSHPAAHLASNGMSPAEAARKAELFAAAERALSTPIRKRWFVPGRIEVLGKHTDYAGGPSLLCAAERGICVIAAERGDSHVRVIDASRQRTAEFPLSADILVTGGWANYVATVVRRLARNFPGASRGADIAFASDLPPAAGLSSSSALIIAIFTALADANRLCDRSDFSEICSLPEELAAYLGCVENGQSYREMEGDCGVGTFGGSEDHTAILCCRPGHVSQYRFCPARFEQHIPFPTDWTFVIGSSGARASKTGAARDLYNRASLAAKAVLEAWNTASGRNDVSLDAALRHSPEAAGEIRAALRSAKHLDFSADELLQRFDHFAIESQEVVPAAASALARQDAAALGEIVDRSQFATEWLLRNQVPETVELARSARQLGAIAASAFGAGFGGSVWALVRRPDAAEFLAEWRACYAASFPGPAQQAEFFLTAAGPALTEL
jgi:galactokinase